MILEMNLKRFLITYSISVDCIYRFARLGKFDFLAMVGKLGIVPIEPGSTYLRGSSGPLKGAKLLFFNDKSVKCDFDALQTQVDKLDDYLKIGKQAIEDSLCNWQKSPNKYRYFKG